MLDSDHPRSLPRAREFSDTIDRRVHLGIAGLVNHHHQRNGAADLIALRLQYGGNSDVQFTENACDLSNHSWAILDGEAHVIFRDDLIDRFARAVKTVRHEAEIATGR